MNATPLSVLIVDDEQPARERLQRLVEELPGCSVADVCSNGADALAKVAEKKPSVVLLDIRMPGMTGIEVARHLGALESPPAIVFTTAYDEYALEAFESQAVGYLLKPVRSERMRKAVTAAYAEKYATKASQKWVQGFAEPAREANTLELTPA